MEAPRAILLVGEGNFSFSAALSQCSKARITATCPQREEEALQHEGTATNIQLIRDSGGAVLFEVDSTTLGECTALKGDTFNRVVFNFPHCGRKSGVKKNRELLKKFFLSCVQVLTEDGEVHVTLCNGQGGTPADQPMREWHNSWQVVAMAAEANLILSSVQPFESENYASYRCTGYRSQDKGFHLEKALLHVFTRSLPYSAAQSLTVEETVAGKRVQYSVPAELSEYICREFLSADSVHPVKVAQDFLLKGLARKWTICMNAEKPPFLLSHGQLRTSGCAADAARCYWIQLHGRVAEAGAGAAGAGAAGAGAAGAGAAGAARSVFVGTQVYLDATHALSAHPCAFSEGGGGHLGQGGECPGCLLALRPSLLPQAEALLRDRPEEEQSEGVGGMKGNPSMAIRNHDDSGEYDGNDSRVGSECFSWRLSGISGLVFRNVPISLWAQPAYHQLLLRGVFPAVCEPIHMLRNSLEALLVPLGVSVVTESGCLRLMAEPMGELGRVFSGVAGEAGRVVVTACLNLDLLSALLFSLPDWRLLWSRHPRFSAHFLGRRFRPFSLHPRPYTLDISFWAGPAWDEGRFHGVVREVSHGSVEQVQLLDTFSHPELSQVSYCYRLSYRSHTHALSHAKALQLHRRLQGALSARLHVTVR